MSEFAEDLGNIGDLVSDIDPVIGRLIDLEDDRQRRKLIMIASESICPPAVRAALASNYTSVYAEGYPARRTLQVPDGVTSDDEVQLAYHRRFGDRRYYKGTELADIVEALAQRRISELFAGTSAVPVEPGSIYANVQALSGAAANNAVYSALIESGDTIMGLDLSHGGHLTHGSPVNRSGRQYSVRSYGVDRATGRIDYDALEATAREAQPRMIVAGGSAYPWDIDWGRLRRIADSLSRPAMLLADISHPAGLVVAGLFPNPIGIADVITFTTHKTLLGPRAAVILTTDPALARRIDQAVFPGEQGGPHLNTIAAMAVCFGLAARQEFRDIQRGTIENTQALANGLTSRGLRLAYGGTNTHLMLVDLGAISTASSVRVNGDLASRILDLAGIVCNKNTIAGDTSAVYPSGLRLGTTWLTQRGFGPDQMDRIAGIIHSVLTSIRTVSYPSNSRPIPRGRIGTDVLQAARQDVALLTATGASGSARAKDPIEFLVIRGQRATDFVQSVVTADVSQSSDGAPVACEVLSNGDRWSVSVARIGHDVRGCPRFAMAVAGADADSLTTWLSDLSDGYVEFDPTDLYARVPGPVAISRATEEDLGVAADALRNALHGSVATISDDKPYFVGQSSVIAEGSQATLPEFVRATANATGPSRTPLYGDHLALGARMVPFAGYDMPIWYSSIGEEHLAVRQSAGLFDLCHMGVLEIAGPGASRFLDLVTTNSVPMLQEGKAQYSYLLDPDGAIMDDILVYRREPAKYMLVVNAANASVVWQWLNAVNSRSVLIDREHPRRTVDSSVDIRDLADPAAGVDSRLDVAVQGPRSLDIVTSLIPDADLADRVRRLGKFDFVEGEVAGIQSLVARTGYTGEMLGYEIYAPAAKVPDLWAELLKVGRAFGLTPTGLGARDSLRTEAGFPLYGHELAGEQSISPIAAGYGGFVKLHKPFFIGRQSLIASEASRSARIVRFRMDGRGRMVRSGDPVVSRRGEYVGSVTSCTAVAGAQFGLAYIEEASAIPGTPIAVYPLSAAPRGKPEKAKSDLRAGDRVLLPENATVLDRFM